MIPVELKQAVYSKKIGRVVKNRLRSGEDSSGKIGLITNAGNTESLKFLEKLPEELGFQKDNFRMVICDVETEAGSSLELIHLKSKEVSASGNFKSESIKRFASDQYDLLVCFFTEKHVPGSLLAAKSNARLTFGNKPDRHNFYDVEITAADAEVFQQEVLKYYKTFKKK